MLFVCKNNKTHEFVDLIAKIGADKGVTFDFANNEKLKASGFALEGVTVNGYKSGAGITINIESNKALNSVVGHEITHVLEGTEHYTELQNAVIEYAKTKGEYQSRLDSITELYKNIKDADINAELTADLVGDYLFTDADFLRNLSAKHRNVFQKLFDEIKYLCKVATAGSKEARELEKVKKSFEKAFRAETKNTVQEDGVKYSISPTFESEYDAWDKTSKGGYFKLGSTSQALESIGINPSNIYWDKSKIIKIKQDHPEMTDDIIKQIPYLLEYPVMVMQSQTAVNRVVAFGEVYADGKPVLCALELKPDGNIANFIKVASAYSKNGAQNLIDTSDILYIDPNKNRTDNWLSALRLQLPAGVTNYGSINSVTYTKKNVKGEFAFGNETNTKSAIQEALERAGYTADQNGQVQYMSEEQKTSDNSKKSLSNFGDDFAPIGDYNVYGEDLALEGTFDEDIGPVAETANSQTSVDSDESGTVNPEKEYISLQDFANNDASVWRNVEYGDTDTKTAIMQNTHNSMVRDGAIVRVQDDVLEYVGESFPDLRGMKKNERTPILKEAIRKLKSDLRGFLSGFKNTSFEFEVNGKILEAKLYNTGINEVLEKITQEKATMLYATEKIFKNARYLYSTQDYDGDPNVYRWNYFYAPVQLGNEIVGVRIAVRDLAKQGESQIYNWNIKKDASLDGGRDDLKNRKPSDVSSDASNNSIAPLPKNVNSNTQLPMDDIGPTRETIAEMENAAPVRETVAEDIGPVKDGVGSGTKGMYVDAKRKDPLI